MQELKKALTQLGLSTQDSAIYLALLEVGESPVGTIANQLGIHRELVYTGLQRLEQEGLVQAIEKKHVHHYQALNPSLLIQKVDEKAALAHSILPQLQSLYRHLPLSVRLLEGSEGFEDIQKDIASSLRDKEEYYVIGSAGNAWYTITEKFYKQYHQRLFKRGIRIKGVTSRTEAKAIKDLEIPGFSEVRVLPDSLTVPSSTMIYADKIVIQIFGERPIALLVQSTQASQAYKEYFFSLWNTAEIVEGRYS